MRPLTPDDLVRGQYAGYRKEAGRGEELRRRNFLRPAAVHRLLALGGSAVVSALRQVSGRHRHRGHGGVEAAAAEAFRRLSANSKSGRANYLRFRLSPNSAIALAARVKLAGKEFVGDQRELYLFEEQPGEESPYERLLGDAMIGDGALFTREDAVEAAWAVVDPVLKTHHRARPYKRRSWGPKEADTIIGSDSCWHNPGPEEASASVSGRTTKRKR